MAGRIDAEDSGFERDEFEAMLASEPWKRYAERVQGALQQEAEICLAETTELRRADQARGAVKALRLALRLPGDMIEEMKHEN